MAVVTGAASSPRLTPPSMPIHTLLVSPAQLDDLLGREDVRVIDVRPKQDYDAGHIPKALSIPADGVNDPTAQVEGARLLDDKLAALFGSRGIDKTTHVVLYDDKGGFHAARLFWMLDYFGHRKVSILNGGIQKWTADGHKLARGPVETRPAQVSRRRQWTGASQAPTGCSSAAPIRTW